MRFRRREAFSCLGRRDRYDRWLSIAGWEECCKSLTRSRVLLRAARAREEGRRLWGERGVLLPISSVIPLPETSS